MLGLCVCVCVWTLYRSATESLLLLFQLKKKTFTNISPCGKSFGYCIMWTTKRFLVFGVPPTVSDRSVDLTEQTPGGGRTKQSALGVSSWWNSHRNQSIHCRGPREQQGDRNLKSPKRYWCASFEIKRRVGTSPGDIWNENASLRQRQKKNVSFRWEPDVGTKRCIQSHPQPIMEDLFTRWRSQTEQHCLRLPTASNGVGLTQMKPHTLTFILSAWCQDTTQKKPKKLII